MSIGRAIKRRCKAMVAPSVFLALTGYFIWSAMQGDRGLDEAGRRHADLLAAQADLAQAKSDLAAWERRVAGLRGPKLDPDALDERARAMLNLSDPAEIIVPYGDGKKLF